MHVISILCYITDAGLQGYHISAIDQNILDTLHVTTTEGREKLLSAVYKELYPEDIVSQTLDELLSTAYLVIHCQS